MTYGIKVSKSGVDVDTADNDELVISSDLESLKNTTVSSLTSVTLAPYPDPDYETFVSFTHNLGYQPVFKVYYDCSDGNFREAIEDSNLLAIGLPDVLTYFWSTTTEIGGYLANVDEVNTFTVRYKIFVFGNEV